MEKFLDKLDSFLFDIIGLIFPGLVFLSVLLTITYNYYPNFFDVDGGSKFYSTISEHYLIIVIIISYLIGHVAKIFSIYYYALMEAIFDKGIVLLIKWIFEYLQKLPDKITLLNEFPDFQFYNSFEKFLSRILRDIFTFRAPSYFIDNEPIKAECLKHLEKEGQFPDNWYSIYKYSKIMNAQNEVKSLTENYLSKYNLYRSLSLIFLIGGIYINLMNNSAIETENFLGIKTEIVLTGTFILWYTFHVKYKRYWTLCGNEALMSLYFYFKNKKSHEVE